MQRSTDGGGCVKLLGLSQHALRLAQPALAEVSVYGLSEYSNPTYYEEQTSSDLTYLLFFTAALLVYLGKTAFDKSGAKSLGDAVSK